MTQKIKLNWVKYEIAAVTIEGMAIGEQVKISGIECRVGDFLVRSPSGLSVATINEEEGEMLVSFPVCPTDVPELELEGE